MEDKQENNKLVQLAQELERQKTTKKDFVVPSDYIKVENQTLEDGQKVLMMYVPAVTDVPAGFGVTPSPMRFGITDHSHSQISEKLKIPKNFYDRLHEQYPELLARNINDLMPEKEKRLVRTLDGNVRAFLSSRYRIIDNYDVLFNSMDVFKKLNTEQNADIQIARADLTDTRLYIKALSETLVDTIFPKKEEKETGDAVKGGIIICNSEVGNGAFKVMPFMEVLRCSNGMISEEILSRIHLGRDKGIGEITFRADTLQKQDEALWLKIRDMIEGTFNPEIFRKWVDKINEVASIEIEKPILAINNVVKNHNLNKDKVESLLAEFAQVGYTKWGLSNAITAVAKTEENYEKQIEMEKVGAEILTAPMEAIVGGDD